MEQLTWQRPNLFIKVTKGLTLKPPFSRKPKSMVSFKYVLSSTNLRHWKELKCFFWKPGHSSRICASCFTGTLGLVSELIRINCMQWCHPCQELKLGCSRKIIRNEDFGKESLLCRPEVCYSLTRKAELLFYTLRWQSEQPWREYFTCYAKLALKMSHCLQG